MAAGRSDAEATRATVIPNGWLNSRFCGGWLPTVQRTQNVKLLRGSFGTYLCYSSNRTSDQDIEGLGGADRAAPCAYVSIVDWLDNCGPARNLGIHAIGLKHGTV
jgi:hypothetical protein